MPWFYKLYLFTSFNNTASEASHLIPVLAIMFQPFVVRKSMRSLQWRHHESDGISNHPCLDCFLIRLFRHTSRETIKFRVTCFCEENEPDLEHSDSRWIPLTKARNAEMLPFHDVIILYRIAISLKTESRHARDLWRLAWSCKQLRLPCPPDPWNLPGTALLNHPGALKSTEYDST